MSSDVQLFDATGRRRSPATLPEFHVGRAPANKGQRYPAYPPTVEEIIAIMRVARARDAPGRPVVLRGRRTHARARVVGQRRSP